MDYSDYAADLEQVLERASEAGIKKIISIGTDFASSRRAVALAEKYPCIYAAVGWHPCGAMEAPDDIRAELRDLSANPKVVAIGETGLDHYHLPSQKGGSATEDEVYKAKQVSLFRQHLEVASEVGLNCVIHQRAAFQPTLDVMGPYSKQVRGVFHCFVDGPEAAQTIFGLGSLVSFTGIVTFKNSQKVKETVKKIGLDQFMLETDAPYLAPAPFRGKRCEPGHVKQIAETVADRKSVV